MQRMRTTLNLDDDALLLAKQYAQREQCSLGTAVSCLIREGSQAHEDLRYWLARTPEERLAAVEILRREHWGITDVSAEPAMERVCRVVRLHHR
jgi:hypothetical protein